MKKLLFLLLIISTLSNLNAQTKDSSINELLLLQSYEKDTSAEALIVYDIGESRFVDSERGFEVHFKRKCRIKILSNSGLSFAEVAIPLYTNDMYCESIVEFSAKTYNMENGVIAVTNSIKKEMLVEKINKNWIQKKIAISGVKEGSVIDFEYTLSSPFIFNLQDWEFQQKVPVIYSEYVTLMIPFYTYTYIAIGTSKFDEFSSYPTTGIVRNYGSFQFQDMVYKFVMKDLPAFRDVDFISTPNDYKVKIDFQLSTINRTNGSKENIITTWPKMISELNKHASFGKYIKSCSGASKTILENSFPTAANNAETLEKLVQYVKGNFSWDEMNSEYAIKKSKNFLNQKSGNAGNINLFLTSLLREAGINANPVIISTRDHGKIHSDYPFAHFFNYVIVVSEIDGKLYLSDATEKLTTFDQLPQRCINEKGLIIGEKEEAWVMLTPKTTSCEDNKFTLKFNENKDSLQCTYTYIASEYDGIIQKKKYFEDKEDYVNKKMGQVFSEITDSKVMASDTVKNFRCQIVGMIKPTTIDSFVSIQPFLNFAIGENPFNKKVRYYDIDMTYSRKRNFDVVFMLPENAKPIHLPENTNINNDDFSFKYNTEVLGNIITIHGEYFLKRPIYEASKYLAIQAFYDKVIKKLNESIEIQL